MAKLPARKFQNYKCVGRQESASSEKSVEVETVEVEKSEEKV